MKISYILASTGRGVRTQLGVQAQLGDQLKLALH